MIATEMKPSEVGEQSLVKFAGRMDLAIELEKRYGGLVKIETPRDREAFRIAIAEHRTCRGEGTKEKKRLTDVALAWQRSVNSTWAKIEAKVRESEDRLKSILQAWDDAREAEKQAKINAERKKLEDEIRLQREAEAETNRAEAARLAAERAEMKAERFGATWKLTGNSLRRI